jgi:catechol 2,3-dioxygenase-like lactoylglutathione lyase family enzyme
MQVEELDRPVPDYLGVELMHVQFAELPVFNQDRAKAFYVAHFGCDVAADQPLEPRGWRWIELQFPDAQTTLHFLAREDEKLSKGPVLVLVDNQIERPSPACSPGDRDHHQSKTRTMAARSHGSGVSRQ